MKISTKVANGMVIAGLVGALGSVGSGGYLIYVAKEHPQVAEMRQEMEELSNNYSSCIRPWADEADCQKIKKRYDNLLQQHNLFEASEEYRQFRKKQDNLLDLLFPLTVGGLVFSLPLEAVGAIAYRRRKEEEFYQDLMGKVEKS